MRFPGQGTRDQCELLLLLLILIQSHSFLPGLQWRQVTRTPKCFFFQCCSLPRCLHLCTFDIGSIFTPEGDLGLQWSSSKQASSTGSQLRLLYWWYRGTGFLAEGHPHTAVSPAASGHLLLVCLCRGLSLPMVLEDSIPRVMGDLSVID